MNGWSELKFWEVVDREIPWKMNGWIFQMTSELGSGDHALNSSRFPSSSTGLQCIIDRRRFLHRNAMKFYKVVVHSIPHNSTEANINAMLEEAVVVDTSILHHAFISIFIPLWAITTHYVTILMPFLSYFIRFT